MRHAEIRNLIETGVADASRQFSKHCRDDHNVQATLVADAPRPPSDRRNNDASTMWITGEERSKEI